MSRERPASLLVSFLVASAVLPNLSGCHAPAEDLVREQQGATVTGFCPTASGQSEVTTSREYVSVDERGNPVLYVLAKLCGPRMTVDRFTRHYMSGRFAGPGPSEQNLFGDAVAEREESPATPADVHQGVTRTVYDAHAMGTPIRTMSKIVQTLSIFEHDYARADFELFPAPADDRMILEMLSGRFAIQIVKGDSPKRGLVFDRVLEDKLRRDGIVLEPHAVYLVERWNTGLDPNGKGDEMELAFPSAPSFFPSALDPKRAAAEFMGSVHAQGTLGSAEKVAARVDDAAVRPGGGDMPSGSLYCESGWIQKDVPAFPDRTIFGDRRAKQAVLVGKDDAGRRNITVWQSVMAEDQSVERLPPRTLRGAACALVQKSLVCSLPREARFWNEVSKTDQAPIARIEIALDGLAFDTEERPTMPDGRPFASSAEAVKTFYSQVQTYPFQQYNCFMTGEAR